MWYKRNINRDATIYLYLKVVVVFGLGVFNCKGALSDKNMLSKTIKQPQNSIKIDLDSNLNSNIAYSHIKLNSFSTQSMSSIESLDSVVLPINFKKKPNKKYKHEAMVSNLSNISNDINMLNANMSYINSQTDCIDEYLERERCESKSESSNLGAPIVKNRYEVFRKNAVSDERKERKRRIGITENNYNEEKKKNKEKRPNSKSTSVGAKNYFSPLSNFQNLTLKQPTKGFFKNDKRRSAISKIQVSENDKNKKNTRLQISNFFKNMNNINTRERGRVVISKNEILKEKKQREDPKQKRFKRKNTHRSPEIGIYCMTQISCLEKEIDSNKIDLNTPNSIDEIEDNMFKMTNEEELKNQQDKACCGCCIQ